MPPSRGWIPVPDQNKSLGSPGFGRQASLWPPSPPPSFDAVIGTRGSEKCPARRQRAALGMPVSTCRESRSSLMPIPQAQTLSPTPTNFKIATEAQIGQREAPLSRRSPQDGCISLLSSCSPPTAPALVLPPSPGHRLLQGGRQQRRGGEKQHCLGLAHAHKPTVRHVPERTLHG